MIFLRPLLISFLLALALAAPLAAAPSKSDLQHARAAWRLALRAENKNDFAGALAQLRAALDFDPGNPQYLAQLERLRAREINLHLQSGDSSLAAGQPAEAMAQFQTALVLDPGNPYARQRLQDAAARLPRPERPDSEISAARAAQSQPIELQPRVLTASINFTGDSRALLTQLAATFGLNATFTERFPTRNLSLSLQNSSLAGALAVAALLAHAMWVPLSTSDVLFAPDNAESHRLYDRQVLRTFYLSSVTTPQDLTDVVSALRSIFDIHEVVPHPAQSSVTIRAPQPVVEAAAQFVQNLSLARPQVMLDVDAYEISHTLMRALGLSLPTQFRLINIPPSLLSLATQSNIQQQIQQILASGGASAANQQQINNLLAQLQQQQSTGLTSLLNEPFLTFGHGQTLFALAIPAALNGSFRYNSSLAADIKNVSLRAAQGATASLLSGQRFPVLTSTFSLGTQSAGLSSFPSFQFVDLGLSLKATPQIHLPPLASGQSASVTLALELSIKGLEGSSINTVPVISNREYKGRVNLLDGEPALLVGAITREQERALTGIPGLGRLPLLGHLFTTITPSNTDDEILILITPHLLSRPASVEQAIWLPPQSGNQ